MQRTTLAQATLAVVLAAGLGGAPALAQETGYFKVAGVEADDMLKMRTGPGIGFGVILGLPNGTILRVQSCEQTGGTRWCKASLKDARRLKGYVSRAYLLEVED